MDKPPPYNPLNQQDVNVQVTQPHGHMTQPQGHTTTVISNQPQTIVMQQFADGNVNMPRGVPRGWSTPLLGCFEDITSCALGFFCHPIATCCLASDMGEPCCTPCCAGLLPMRSNFRGKHNIQGSIINDCCTVLFCGPCAGCQMHRELNNMKAGRAAP